MNFLYCELREVFKFPSQESVRKNIPPQFAEFPTTRVIIDCSELFIQTASSLTAQSQTWSSYKHHNTFKFLVGCTPNGTVSFISELWGGRSSDKIITEKSGLLDLLQEGDNVMADRGFDIDHMLPEGVTLNIPPFKGKAAQLSAEDTERTMKIASVRILVERVIGRIKNFHILEGAMPISLTSTANQIIAVCSYLTNFWPVMQPPAWSTTM